MIGTSMKQWIVVATLLAISIWTANLTLYNWWAAGGPPTPNPQEYESRGNIFAVVTLLLFSAAVAVALLNRKRSLRR
jgi:membrane protein DedA with SNARE-associated domain